MKYAVKMIETLTRTVIVEADNYLEAKEKVFDSYYRGWLQLHADNSAVDLELDNDTAGYVDLFGPEWWRDMEVEDLGE